MFSFTDNPLPFGDRMIGTYYGFYNTLSGVGIAAGNLLTGAAFDAGEKLGVPGVPWWSLTILGCACAVAVLALSRSGRLDPEPVSALVSRCRT